LQRIAEIDDGTANNRASLSFNNSAAQFDFFGGGTAEAALTAGTIITNSTARMAAAFQANDFVLVEGGGTPSTASGGAIPSTFSKLRLGADVAGANYLFGHVAEIGVWNNLRAPNAGLQGLT